MLEIAFVQRLTKEKDEVIHNIQKRNKPIRVAKKSDGGRLSVEDYISDGLATDSDDSRKMRRAKTRLRKKRKILHQKAIVNLRYSGLIFLVKPKLNPSNSIQFLISPSQIKKIYGSRCHQPTSSDSLISLISVLSMGKPDTGSTTIQERTLYNRADFSHNIKEGN